MNMAVNQIAATIAIQTEAASPRPCLPATISATNLLLAYLLKVLLALYRQEQPSILLVIGLLGKLKAA